MTNSLERRAVAAATAVARTHGLGTEGAVVVHSGTNVLIHLRPAPVVARVMTGTVVLHAAPERWLERELAVCEFLAPSGLAVLPSRLIAPGPHERDGLWLTFTEWMPGAEPAGARLANAHELGATLRDLHHALRAFDGELEGPGAVLGRIRRLLDQLRRTDRAGAGTLSSLSARLDALAPAVFTSSLPNQALHGDVSLRNLLRTPTQLIWNDFEDTFRGPVHWDVASYVGSLRSEGADPGFVREMLDAYGWGDEQELAPFLAAQDVYDEIWGMHDRQRRRS